MPPFAPNQKPQFLPDMMLGRLARWLRMLGYFAQAQANFDDDALIRLASKSRLILLTCDEQLFWKAKDYCRCVLIQSGNLDNQLLQVCSEFSIDLAKIKEKDVPSEKFCSVCNGQLRRVQKSKIRRFIPPKSYKSSPAFHQCLSCRKIFWEGSHNLKIQEKFRSLRRIQRSTRKAPTACF